MKDELMILLGCGLTALLVTNACSSMYENEDSDDEFGESRTRRRSKSRYDCEGFSSCDSGYPSYEAVDMPLPTPAEKFSVDYYNEPKAEQIPSALSPMMFSEMVSNEPYLESDYVDMKSYLENPDGIKVYNEKDGSIGLPVTDMTSISAGENNKYVYDRTIGTIGFTSTKIGGRFRGQADYIRGDIPVIPNKTGWFQVSSDPANKLMLGAMNVANGIGQAPAVAQKKSGAQFALSAVKASPDDPFAVLRKQQERSNAPPPSGGGQHALRAPVPEVTVADIMNLGSIMNQSSASSSGVASSVNPSSSG